MFYLDVPENYLKGNNFPAIIHIHGYTSYAHMEAWYTKFNEYGTSKGYVTVFAEGHDRLSWNAGGCCGAA